jgi:hypothetical protein
MNKRLENFIQGLSIKDLLYMYETYCDMAFTFYIDCEEEKYTRTMIIINLIDERLREKGIWVKK